MKTTACILLAAISATSVSAEKFLGIADNQLWLSDLTSELSEGIDTIGNGVSNAQPKRAEGASESSRYECETCQNHFCIDCDVFCHEVIHNCPGCQSTAHLPQTERTNGHV